MKSYFKIDQHLVQHFEYYGACLSILCSQIITPIFNAIISTNQETGVEFLPIVESLYPYFSSSVEFLLLDDP